MKYMRDEPHAGNVGPVRTKEQPVQRPWGRTVLGGTARKETSVAGAD